MALLCDDANAHCDVIPRPMTDAYCICDCCGGLDGEIDFLREHVNDTEHLANIASAEDEMRLLYLETACTHVARARKANKTLHLREDSGQRIKDEDEDETKERLYEMDMREARESLLIDLETRLRNIGGEAILDKAIIESKENAPGKHHLRRVKSFAGLYEAKPHICWRNYSRSRSWELLPGLPG